MLNKEIFDNSEILLIILTCTQLTPGLQLRVTNIHTPMHVKSCQQIPAREKNNTQISTVRPLLSGHLLSGHPPFSGHFPKSRFICQQTAAFDTSVQRPPLLSDRGHLFAVTSVLFIWCFTSIKRPADYIFKQWRIILNKSSVKDLEQIFYTY